MQITQADFRKKKITQADAEVLEIHNGSCIILFLNQKRSCPHELISDIPSRSWGSVQPANRGKNAEIASPHTLGKPGAQRGEVGALPHRC
jgi:hypothetical protein